MGKAPILSSFTPFLSLFITKNLSYLTLSKSQGCQIKTNICNGNNSTDPTLKEVVKGSKTNVGGKIGPFARRLLSLFLFNNYIIFVQFNF